MKTKPFLSYQIWFVYFSFNTSAHDIFFKKQTSWKGEGVTERERMNESSISWFILQVPSAARSGEPGAQSAFPTWVGAELEPSSPVFSQGFREQETEIERLAEI